MADQDWRAALATVRTAERLSQAALATRAGVSVGTVKAYESGRRQPSRALLTSLLEALKMDRGQRNTLLQLAGFAPDGDALGPSGPGYLFSVQQAIEELEARQWPGAVLNEMMEVVAANRLLQQVWDVELDREFKTSIERNILSVISLPRFDGRLLNWDDCVTVGISVVKGHHRGPEPEPGVSPYFAAVFQHFMSGAPNKVARLAELWDRTPPREPKIRWSYPIEWEDPEAGRLNFDCLVTTANEPDGLAFTDWIPTDAATWQRLEAIRSRPRPTNPR